MDEQQFLELKKAVFWLGISCLCAGISLLILSELILPKIEKRLLLLEITTHNHRADIDGLYQRVEKRIVPVGQIL